MDIFKGRAAVTPGGMDLNFSRLGELAAERLTGPYAAPLLMGIVDTEVSRKGGFLPDGRLRLLFEAHRFGKYTDYEFNQSHRNISSRGWDRTLYWGGAAEYVRMTNAMALNREAALMSASYGWPQIMGDEHKRCGYDSAEAMICAFADDSTVQIVAMVDFLASKNILQSLNDFDFERVSLRYNGRRYKKNRHHIKLGSNVAQRAGAGDWCRIGGAGVEVLQLQTALKRSGWVLAADGAFGPATGQALVEFQKSRRMPLPEGLLS